MGKTEGLLEKVKNIRRDQWIVLLLAGILLIMLSLPAGKTGKTDADLQEQAQAERESGKTDTADMEKRLEEILGQMAGAGDVRVMITVKDNGQRIVEKDEPSVSRSTQEQSGSGTANSTVEQENQETTVYEKDGSGKETPYVARELAPQIEGVLVLAEGAGDANVKKEITEAVMALFGLDAHKIKVMKMNERRG